MRVRRRREKKSYNKVENEVETFTSNKTSSNLAK